jgi:hypothetical protein
LRVSPPSLRRSGDSSRSPRRWADCLQPASPGIAGTSAPDVVHEATMWGRVAPNIHGRFGGALACWGDHHILLMGCSLAKCFHTPALMRRPITLGRELEIFRKLEGRPRLSPLTTLFETFQMTILHCLPGLVCL